MAIAPSNQKLLSKLSAETNTTSLECATGTRVRLPTAGMQQFWSRKGNATSI